MLSYVKISEKMKWA